MKFIAIDPGFDKVGYAVFEKGNDGGEDFEYLFSNLIKTSRKDLHENRLKQIYNELDEIIKKEQVEALIVEKLFMFKNKKTFIKVAQAIGVVEVVAAKNNIIVKRLTPLQIKQIVTGYGTADKKSVHKMLELSFGDKIKVKDDDEADAIACGLAYCYVNEELI